MTQWRNKIGGILALLVICNSVAAHATEMPTSNDPALNAFAHAYYNAMTTHDVAKLRAIIYPPSLKCIDAASPIWFQQNVSIFPLNVQTSDPGWSNLDPTDAKAWAPQIKARLPEADMTVVVDWKETKGNVTTNHPSMVSLKKIADNYVQVLPCPSATDIQARNAFFAKRAGQQ